MKLIDTLFEGYFGTIALIGAGLIILAVTISTTGYIVSKQELSAAKRYYLSQVDNSNTSDIISVKNEIKKKFPGFDYLFFKAGEIKVESEASNDFSGSLQKDPTAGYYGRPLTLRVYRKVKFFFNPTPFIISIGGATVNRTKLSPNTDNSLEYRLGSEFS